MRIKVALAGLGARGYDTYAKYQHLHPDRMEIVAIADTNPKKVAAAQKEFNILPQMCFASAEEMLKMGKLADCIFIATQDKQHLDHTIKALEVGYDILLEKPIAASLDDCLKILQKAHQENKLVLICHVLRYTVFYKTIKNIIDSGKLGDIVSVQAIENVGYWHQAHSFVRGNWRRSEDTTPMILQKCCHDFDIISWLIGKKCLSLSSYGSLKYFNKANAPKGCSDYCLDCLFKQSCEYSALKIYLENDQIGFLKGNSGWPCNVVAAQPTEQKLLDELKNGQYGRCVFGCDNTVVDHQIVSLQFEDDITVSFTMCAFTAQNAREIKVMGTKGEIYADQHKNIVSFTPFGEKPQIYDINTMATDLSGHGGGDNAMLDYFFDSLLNQNTDKATAIENSIQSHIIAFAAEASRLAEGKKIDLEQFVQK